MRGVTVPGEGVKEGRGGLEEQDLETVGAKSGEISRVVEPGVGEVWLKSGEEIAVVSGSVTLGESGETKETGKREWRTDCWRFVI